MTGDLEVRIRERAHLIWEREGRPQGRDIAHWHQAAAEIGGEAPARAPSRKTTATAPTAARETKAAAPESERAPKRAAAARATTPLRSRKAKD